MTTVNELIKILQKVDDKDQIIYIIMDPMTDKPALFVVSESDPDDPIKIWDNY